MLYISLLILKVYDCMYYVILGLNEIKGKNRSVYGY